MIIPNEVLNNLTEYSETTINEYLDYIYDENTHKMTIIGTEAKSIQQWCKWAIITERYKYSIYDWSYGSEIVDELYGQSNTDENIKDMIELDIIECLKANQFIDEVEVKEITLSRHPTINIYMKVYIKTIFGEEITDEYNL